MGSGWSLDAYGSLGWTRLGTADSVFVGGEMVSSRFGLSLSGPISGTERLSFGLAQPLTIESGTLKMLLGTGYDLAQRTLIMQERSASIRSARRPVMLTGGYSKVWSTRHSLGFGVSYDAAVNNASALFSFKMGL